jgi:superfamily I DNA and/or RNA helicase
VAGAAALIATEANKQKRHMPVRRLIEQAGPVVQALKPCMMMSPLSVSQFLPSTMRYDLVIFDEASPVKPADAINCIYRGQQLVIAGDQKQLPPTPFFDKLDSDSGDEWSEEQFEDFESILDVAKGSGGLQSIALRWHYRSQREDLITYSNYRFYDGGSPSSV